MKTFNLLPEDKKKALQREYLMRISTLFFMMLFFTGIVVFVFLLPSFLNVIIRYGEASMALENLKKETPELLEIEELEAAVNRINNKLIALEPEDAILPSEAINRVIENQLTGVSIRSFSFKLGDDHEQAELKISGVAANRETLTNFVRNLNQEEIFHNVNLPVSNLAGDKNINFSITLSVRL